MIRMFRSNDTCQRRRDRFAESLERDGFVSRILQHEYDHLEGVLLVDRMSPADKQRHRAALEELVEEYRAAHPSARARRTGAGARRR